MGGEEPENGHRKCGGCGAEASASQLVTPPRSLVRRVPDARPAATLAPAHLHLSRPPLPQPRGNSSLRSSSMRTGRRLTGSPEWATTARAAAPANRKPQTCRGLSRLHRRLTFVVALASGRRREGGQGAVDHRGHRQAPQAGGATGQGAGGSGMHRVVPGAGAAACVQLEGTAQPQKQAVDF